jgi:DNA repair exonuclease SbcCD ATPase subunit
MKTKVITIILSVLLVISAALNIYQYQSLNTMKSQYTTLQSDIDNLNNEINSLNDTISANEDEITALSSEKIDLENTLEELQAENETLQADIELDEDEYKGDDPADAANMTVPDLAPEEYQEHTTLYDLNGDGVVTQDEVDEVDAMFDEIDRKYEETHPSSSSSTTSDSSTSSSSANIGTPDQTDESTFGTHWGTGDYTGLENYQSY